MYCLLLRLTHSPAFVRRVSRVCIAAQYRQHLLLVHPCGGLAGPLYSRVSWGGPGVRFRHAFNTPSGAGRLCLPRSDAVQRDGRAVVRVHGRVVWLRSGLPQWHGQADGDIAAVGARHACVWWFWKSHYLHAVVSGYPKRLIASDSQRRVLQVFAHLGDGNRVLRAAARGRTASACSQVPQRLCPPVPRNLMPGRRVPAGPVLPDPVHRLVARPGVLRSIDHPIYGTPKRPRCRGSLCLAWSKRRSSGLRGRSAWCWWRPAC